VQNRRKLEGEREHLLDRDDLRADVCREPRPLQELEDQEGPLALEHGVEGADQAGVPEGVEGAGLPGEPVERPPVAEALGAHDLDGHERVRSSSRAR
jgi:hypothetical protein